MKRLCRVLDLPLYQAAGLLELLWHLTAREAPRGDIGKLSNEDIALALDYRGDEDALIEALVRTRWLDRDDTHRLLVHDWHEHADEAVKKRLTRSGRSFISSRRVETNSGNVETNPSNGKLPRAGAGPEPEPEPVPVPVPEPVPEPKTKPKSFRDKREVDPRHTPFKDEIECYQKAKGVVFAWDGSDAKQLDLLLKSAPDLTFDDFKRCLMHRARSPGTPHGERPRVWLPYVLKYQEAPINEFGKTGVSNGNRNHSKTAGNLDAAKEAIAILERARASRSGERNRAPADQMHLETGCSGESGDLSYLRDGSLEATSG